MGKIEVKINGGRVTECKKIKGQPGFEIEFSPPLDFPNGTRIKEIFSDTRAEIGDIIAINTRYEERVDPEGNPETVLEVINIEHREKSADKAAA
ncbi:MAG: hypothetical protein K9L85_00080 [Candidatus Peribacteraceae bacterium]|nr:hypothetical protein [Candidatus Peribacteraceae bacterium]